MLQKLFPTLSRTLCTSNRYVALSYNWFSTTPSEASKDVEDFELLPPGCSIADPAYGISDGQKVVRYDGKEEEDVLATPLKKKRALPPMPPNLAAAQQQLMNKTPHSMKKKKKKEEDDDDFFELLPPGSSMVDPGGHLEGSADDEKRIYYRDPVPEPPKK